MTPFFKECKFWSSILRQSISGMMNEQDILMRFMIDVFMRSTQDAQKTPFSCYQCIIYHVHMIFDHFQENRLCNPNMVCLWLSPWYPTHVTKNAVWTFALQCEFSVMQKKMQCINNYMTKSCMSEHNMWNDDNIMYVIVWTKKKAKWICMEIQWLMQMRCMNMINDECRNDMSIMMPWRDARCDQGNKTRWVCSVS